MRPATAKVEEAPLKCWSKCERLKQTWEPVITAGATAFKTSANQPHRAVPDAQQLYAAAADALAEAVSENREEVSAWLRELLLGEDTPPGAARSVIRCSEVVRGRGRRASSGEVSGLGVGPTAARRAHTHTSRGCGRGASREGGRDWI